MLLLSKRPIANVQKLGRFLGRLFWRLSRSRRNVAIINAQIIGAADPIKTAKLSFEHTFCTYLESSYTHKVDREFIERYVAYEGKQHYDNLIEKGERFAILTAHLGSWELAAQVIPTLYGFKALVAGRAAKIHSVEKAIRWMRNVGSVVYISDRYIEKLSEYERRGYYSASLLDHGGTASDSVLAPFFGYKVYTLAGLCAMCVRRKIPMLPCYLLRTENGFKAITHPPIYPEKVEGDRKSRITMMAAQVNREYEKIIQQFPEQWYLLHRRFKRIEENGKISKRIYQKRANPLKILS
jgi:KDO2-lipid IV(A) lauroyltransferase